jgi:glycosyltransferase involved in cell wall biosynthesis
LKEISFIILSNVGKKNMDQLITKRLFLVGYFSKSIFNSKSVSQEMAERLLKCGWQIFTSSHKRNPLARLVDMMWSAWKFRKEYSVAHIDVYSNRSFIWAEIVCLVLYLLRKKYILTLHGGGLPEFATKWPRRVHLLLHSAHKVTAPSEYLRHHMQKYRQDILIIPNPIDVDRFFFRHRMAATAHMVWVRSFHDIYNPSLAIKVLEILNKKHIDASLVMIGPDKHDGSLLACKQLARQLNIKSKVEFKGAIPNRQIPVLLNQADIFLNTTNFDNTPVSVIEAMASGLCIVSTNVGGLPHLLENGKDSLLVPPENPDLMAKAVEKFINNPNFVQKVSNHARRKVEGIAWERILSKWEDLYCQIINKYNAE